MFLCFLLFKLYKISFPLKFYDHAPPMFLGSSLSGGSWSAAAYTHTYFVPHVELFWFLELRFGFLNWRTGSFIVGEIIRSDMGFGGSFFHPLSSMYNEILKDDTR